MEKGSLCYSAVSSEMELPKMKEQAVFEWPVNKLVLLVENEKY